MGHIRPLFLDDYDQVLSLNASAQPNVSLMDRAELTRLQALSKCHVVLVQAEVVVAYALAFFYDDVYDGEEFLILKSMISQPFMYIDQVVVRTTAQGKGIGRLLYDALAQAALTRPIYCMCCEVNAMPPNSNSLAFHHHLGFTAIGSFATLDGRTVDLLQKHLAVPA